MIQLKLKFVCEHCLREPPVFVNIKGTRAYVRSALEEIHCSHCGSVMCEV